MARNLAFLEGRSLGQVCHIIQLAISQKKMLGYLNGSVVPYSHSQSMIKEQCAQLNAACKASLAAAGVSDTTGAPKDESELSLATWETARKHLKEILEENASKSGSLGTVPLSNVKRLFRSKFQTELSETKLGHSKISELLQDQRFGDICTLELQPHGYIVVQVEVQESSKSLAAEEATGADGMEYSWDYQGEKLTMSVLDVLADELRRQAVTKAKWPSLDGCWEGLVQRTFIHATPPPPTPPAHVKRRSASLPRDLSFSSDEDAKELDNQRFAGITFASDSETPLHAVLDQSDSNSEISFGNNKENHRLQFCVDEPLVLDEDTLCFDSVPATQSPSVAHGAGKVLALVTQSPSSIYSPCLKPNWPWLSQETVLEAECPETWNQTADNTPCNRIQFCADEPLSFEDTSVLSDSSRMNISRGKCEQAWKITNQSPLSLLKSSHVGSIALSKVQNTFIHSPLPPPTPFRLGAANRSRSLPKDHGSDKDAFEAFCQALDGSWLLDRKEALNQQCLYPPTPYMCGRDADSGLLSSHGPNFIPPSPALTASPIYSCKAYQLESDPASLPLCGITSYTHAINDHEIYKTRPSATGDNIIRLANYLQ